MDVYLKKSLIKFQMILTNPKSMPCTASAFDKDLILLTRFT